MEIAAAGVGGGEVVSADHRRLEIVPLVAAAPFLPRYEGMAGDQHDPRMQGGRLQQAGEQHGAVDAVGVVVLQGLAGQPGPLGEQARAGPEVDDRVNIRDPGLFQRVVQGFDLARHDLRRSLIAPDLVLGDQLGRAAEQGLDRLDVRRDPGAVVAGQVGGQAGLGVDHRVEAGVPRQQQDALRIVRLDELAPGVAGRAIDGDDDVQGGALDLGDPARRAGQETGEQRDRPALVHPLQLDGPDRPGREPFEVGRDADPARLVRLVLHGDGQQGVGGGVEQVVDAGGDGLEPQGRGDLQAGRLGAEERAQGSAGGLPGGTLGVLALLLLPDPRRVEGLLRLDQLVPDRLVGGQARRLHRGQESTVPSAQVFHLATQRVVSHLEAHRCSPGLKMRAAWVSGRQRASRGPGRGRESFALKAGHQRFPLVRVQIVAAGGPAGGVEPDVAADVPELEGRIVADRGEPGYAALTEGSERDLAHAARVALEGRGHGQLVDRFGDVPEHEVRLLALAGRDEPAAEWLPLEHGAELDVQDRPLVPPQWRPVLAPCDVPEEHGGVHPARGEELAVGAEVERKDPAGVAPQLPGIDRTVRVREVPEVNRPVPGRRREEVAYRAKRGGLHFPAVPERFRQAADPGGVADVPEDDPLVIAARGHHRARRVGHHVVDRAHVGFLEIGDGDRPAVRLRVGVAGPGHVPEQDVPGQVARDEEPTAGAERQAEHGRTAALEPGQRLEDFKPLAAVRPVAGHRGNGPLPELADAATGTGAGRRHDPIGAIGDGLWRSVRPPQGAGQGAAGSSRSSGSPPRRSRPTAAPRRWVRRPGPARRRRGRSSAGRSPAPWSRRRSRPRA